VAKEQDYAGSMLVEYKSRSETSGQALLRLRRTMESLGIAVGSVVLPPLAALAEVVAYVVSPVIWLAETFPWLTAAAFGVVGGFVSLKLATMACSYVGTLFSDGVMLGKGALNALRLSSIKASVAILRHAVAIRYAAISSTVANGRIKAHAAWQSVLTAKTKLAAVGQWVLNAAMSANPIGMVVVAIGALVAWFASAYAAAGSFTGAVKLMWNQFKTVIPAMEVVEAAVMGTVQFVSDLWNGVSLYDAGAKLIGTLWDGVVAMWDRVKSNWTAIKSFFGFGDDAEVAVKPLEPVATTQTVAAPVAAVSASSSSAAPAASASKGTTPAPSGAAPAPRPAHQAATGASAPQINFSISFSGVPSQAVGSVLVNAIKAKERELASYFEKMLADIASNQRRLAYD
jgi:hypothetical protein